MLEYRQLAGYMLLGTGCIGMVITVGSVIGWVDVVRNGRVIPPAKVSAFECESRLSQMAPAQSAAIETPILDTKT